MPAGDRDAVQSAIQALKDAIGGDDAEQIKQKTEALAQVAMKLGEAHVQGAAERRRRVGRRCGGPGAGGAGGGPGGAAGNDKVVDADFEEVDDQKRRGSA